MCVCPCMCVCAYVCMYACFWLCFNQVMIKSRYNICAWFLKIFSLDVQNMFPLTLVLDLSGFWWEHLSLSAEILSELQQSRSLFRHPEGQGGLQLLCEGVLASRSKFTSLWGNIKSTKVAREQILVKICVCQQLGILMHIRLYIYKMCFFYSLLF